MLQNKVNISQWLVFSFVCINLSDACSLESFLIFGCFAIPLSTVGLHCAVEYVNATCVACADPFTVSYSLSSGDVHKQELISSSELCVVFFGFFSTMG